MASCLQVVNEQNEPCSAQLRIPKEFEVFQSFRVGFGPGNVLGVLADSGKQAQSTKRVICC